MIEESYKDGKRIERESPDSQWDVVRKSWGWDAVQRTGPTELRDRVNFPKFDQAESYAIDQSKATN